MSLLDRLRRLIASNVNALFDSLTDPGSAIDELVANMEAAAREARGQVKDALAQDRLALKLEETTEQSIREWGARAERAVQAKDDDLAAEALAQQATLRSDLERTLADREVARVQLAELTHGLRELEGKIATVKARKETLKAVMRARKQGGGAVEKYENIVTGVDVAEAEVQLGADLGDRETNEATATIRDRIEKLESNREVDSRLAALKEKMAKKE